MHGIVYEERKSSCSWRWKVSQEIPSSFDNGSNCITQRTEIIGFAATRVFFLIYLLLRYI